jgi:hypothetical protein
VIGGSKVAGEQDNRGRAAGRVRAAGLLAFLGFFLMIAAWSVAAPYNGTPDEQAHIVRAAGVAYGQFAPAPALAAAGTGAFQQVPRGFAGISSCWQFQVNVPAGCAAPPGSDRTLVTVGTAAGRYNPVYYALVGWPLRLWPGMPGVLLARLIGAAASAGLLAGAFVSAMRWSRLRMIAVGLVAVATPMTLQMTSAVNPNGLEIAAGVCLFAAGIPLLVRHDDRFDRRLLWLFVISAAILATLRSTGPLWLAFAVVALLLPFRPSVLRRLLKMRAVLWSAAALVLVVLLGVGWTFMEKASVMGTPGQPHQYSSGTAVWLVLREWRTWVDSLVGIMSWLDTELPSYVYLIWEFAVAGLIIAALAFAGRVDRWRMFVIFFGGVITPTLLQVSYLNKYGFVTQGRYLLPLLSGLVLLAAFILEESGMPPRVARFIGRLAVLVLLPLNVFALAYTMVRWQHGLRPYPVPSFDLNPLRGSWHPALGSVVPLVAELVGGCVVGALLWTTVGRPATELPSPGDAAAAGDRLPDSETTGALVSG